MEMELSKPREPETRGRRVAYYAAIGLALLCFVVMASRQINFPGPYYDECWAVNTGVYLAKGQVNSGYSQVWGVKIGGFDLPVMCSEYIGAVKAYVLALSFSIFGVSIPVMRLTMVFVALLGIVYAARFSKEAFGPLASVYGVWLIATDPSLIIFSRHDWGPIAISFTLRTASLFYLARWWKSGGRRVYLVAACALLGLGVFDKTSFMWFVLAVIAAGAYVWLVSKNRPRLTVADSIWALAAGLITSGPLLAYNLLHHWITFRMIKEPGQEVTLASLLANVSERSGALFALIDGRATDGWMFGAKIAEQWGVSTTLLFPLTIGAAIALLIASLVTRRWKLLAPPLLIAAMVAQIYATPRHVWAHHWIGIYPFPHLMIGAACVALGEMVRNLRVARTVALAAGLIVVAAGVFCNTAVMRGYHQLMRERGGEAPWSDAVYELSNVAQARFADRPIQLMDWGVGNQLMVLSGGRLRLSEPYWSFIGLKEPDERFMRMVKDRKNVFVLLDAPEGGVVAQEHNLLEEAARRACLKRDFNQQFTDRRGRAIFSLVTFAPAECQEVISSLSN